MAEGHPRHPRSTELLTEAHALRRAGRLARAAERYAEVLALDPDHEEARYFLAVVTPGHWPDFVPVTVARQASDPRAMLAALR